MAWGVEQNGTPGLEHRDRLRVYAGDGVSHHHEIRGVAEVLGPEAVHDPDAAAGEKSSWAG